jgi:hypothetical protein
MPKQRALALTEWDLGPEFDAPEPGPGKIAGPEELFAAQCRAFKLPAVEQQVRFAAKAMGRNWRFDFAFREYMLAVEIQGVVVRRIGGKVYTMGGHADVKGMRNDHLKHNAAILLGWSVLQFMQDEVKPKRAIETTMRVLSARGWSQQP